MTDKTYWDGIRDVINTLESIVDNDPKVLNLLTAQQALSILLTGLKRDVEDNGQ